MMTEHGIPDITIEEPLTDNRLVATARARLDRKNQRVWLCVIQSVDVSRDLMDDPNVIAAIKLKHPGINRVRDAGTHEDRAFLAYEWVDGATLEQVMDDRGVLSENAALSFAEGIAMILDDAWKEKKVIHGGLSMQTVLVDNDGTIRLTGFGLSRAYALAHERGMDVEDESVYFVSPERAHHLHDLDGRADMYSLGALLYQMVTGVLPFGEYDESDIPKQHVHDTLSDPQDLNPKISSPLAWLIEKLMIKARELRPGSWQDVLDDIATVREGRIPLSKPIEEGISTVSRGSQRAPFAPSDTQRVFAETASDAKPAGLAGLAALAASASAGSSKEPEFGAPEGEADRAMLEMFAENEKKKDEKSGFFERIKPEDTVDDRDEAHDTPIAPVVHSPALDMDDSEPTPTGRHRLVVSKDLKQEVRKMKARSQIRNKVTNITTMVVVLLLIWLGLQHIVFPMLKNRGIGNANDLLREIDRTMEAEQKKFQQPPEPQPTASPLRLTKPSRPEPDPEPVRKPEPVRQPEPEPVRRVETPPEEPPPREPPPRQPPPRTARPSSGQKWNNPNFVRGARLFNEAVRGYNEYARTRKNKASLAGLEQKAKQAAQYFEKCRDQAPDYIPIDTYLQQCNKLIFDIRQNRSL